MKKLDNRIRIFKNRDDWVAFLRTQRDIEGLLTIMLQNKLRDIRTDDYHITRTMDNEPIIIEELNQVEEESNDP